MKIARKCTYLTMLLMLLAGSAMGEDQPIEPAPTDQPNSAPAMTAVDQEAPAESEVGGGILNRVEEAKQPAPWLKFNGDIRLREIFAPNLVLDQEDRHFQRFRFRLGATVTPVENIDINARAVWEPRHYCEPDRRAQVREGEYIDEWTLNEVIIDKLNVHWKNIGGLPLAIKAGRQDLIFGNGWLVLDGTPLDGSRTIFFDAVRATLELKDIDTTVDLVYIDQHADSDRWFEPFGDEDFHNIEQDEKGAILYVTNKSIENTQIDGYFIYKKDQPDIGTEPGDVRAGHLAPWQTGTHGEIYTYGARVLGNVGENWKYRGEFAQQFGHKSGAALCAWGVNTRLEYHFNDEHKNSLHAGYEFLSGDDPDTDGKNEQFDPLWGRWPQWSELLAYGVALENRPGEFTNLHRLNMGWNCVPMEKLTFRADYNLLFTDEKAAYGTRGATFNPDSCFRGQLWTAVLGYKFNEHINGHLVGELFCPGDWYGDDRNDAAALLRYELTFAW
jgi:hypothetical protein